MKWESSAICPRFVTPFYRRIYSIYANKAVTPGTAQENPENLGRFEFRAKIILMYSTHNNL